MHTDTSLPIASAPSLDTSPSGPARVWSALMAGNERFVSDTPEHPHQDAQRRAELATTQRPLAAVFGCSDSRLAAEIIFDLGLGDLFVVRNAGHVIADTSIGSVEYAVEALGVRLILILGHDACGAVAAAIAAEAPGAQRHSPAIEVLIQSIAPAVQRVKIKNQTDGLNRERDASEVGREHLRNTAHELLRRSPLIADAVAEGRTGIVAANYRLADGHVIPDLILGLSQAGMS